MCCALSIFVRLNFGGRNGLFKDVERETNRQVEIQVDIRTADYKVILRFKYIKLVAEVGGVGAAKSAKAIAKMNKVRGIMPNWGKECGGVGGQRCRVGIDRYRMFL